MRKLFLLLVIAAAVWPQAAQAKYLDEVDAGYQEIWQAAQDTLKPLGIKKINEKKGEITSRWQEDMVERRRGLLKSFAAGNYMRRYRITYRIRQDHEWVNVEVRGTFQERPTGGNFSTPWAKVYKLDRQDLDLERAFFIRMLQQMAANRTKLTQ